MKITGLALVLAAGLAASACVTTATDSRGERIASLEEAARFNVQLGLEYLHQGRRDLALEKLNRALEQDPRLADAHTAIAYVYDQVGEDALADRHYRRALRLDTGNPYIQNTYGAFLCSQGRLREAERQFLRAARNTQYTTPEVAWTNAGICAEREPDVDKAESHYRQALRLNPRHADALWQMANLGFATENGLQARAFLQRYLDAAQPSAESMWLGYRIESMIGDREAALRFAARLRERFADSPEARLLREHERAGER